MMITSNRFHAYAACVVLGLLSGGYVMMVNANDSGSDAGPDADVQAAVNYVNEMTETCVLDHGYKCAPVVGDDFLKIESEAKRIPGPWLEAWPAALTALVTSNELTTEQKLLRHYKIGFAEDETHYLVLFDALSLPLIEDGEITGILQNSIGKSTKVWVDKNSLAVTDMKFLR